MSSYLKDAGVFLASWLRAPGSTGAVWPSSGYLADRLAAVLDEPHMPRCPLVAELGPGTGPATRRIQRRLEGRRGQHIAIDLNVDFVRMLDERFPHVEAVCDSATELPRVLKDRDVDRVDAVISGLPFAAFPAALQTDIMDAVLLSLAPHGVFTTFNYVGAYSTPAAKRFRKLLEERFAAVERHGPELRNLPPAHVLTARCPRT